MQYSEDELLTEIQRVAEEVAHPPTLEEFRDHGKYAVTTYFNRFGSWREALEKAGFSSREPNTAIPKEELITELQQLAPAHEEPPTAAQMNDHGKYWASTYRRRFGSWNAALEAAGFDPVHMKVTTADLIVELRRLADSQDDPPTFAEMNDEGSYSASTYVRRFGSWNSALEAAGLKPTSPPQPTDSQLLAELHRLAETPGEPPTAREMDAEGKYSSATYQRHFGSWSAALAEAFDNINRS